MRGESRERERVRKPGLQNIIHPRSAAKENKSRRSQKGDFRSESSNTAQECQSRLWNPESHGSPTEWATLGLRRDLASASSLLSIGGGKAVLDIVFQAKGGELRTTAAPLC